MRTRNHKRRIPSRALSLRHVDEMLATRGVTVSHETVRQWGIKFGQAFANQIRRRLPRAGDK